MSHWEIIQAWKDEEFRLRLTPAQQAQLPAHPAGWLELDESDLDVVVGGLAAQPPVTGCARYCQPPVQV